ncbi:hypothetical protein [Acidovorax delafieldii]|uniref:hypothetical protein n=1 Tax=Acidovorax delafieldii TaxID=47920 RepID=UPI003ECDFA13
MKDKTTSQWLADQQALAGVSDEALASVLGYESPKVIQMFKSGDMKVPISKVPVLADALDLNPGLLMRRVLNDLSPEMLHAVEHCLGALCLSEGEQKLIAAIRKANPSKEPVPIMFDRDAIITLVVA